MATAPTTPPADGPPLPTPPSTTDPANFDSRGDAMFGALPALQTEMNAAKANVFDNATKTYNNAVDAAAQAADAAAQKVLAAAQASAAATSAASALTAPGTNATSTTSMTVGTGSQAFTLAQTGKSFVVGQWVSISDSAAPTTNWMLGAITAFNAGTGAITVSVSAAQGTLTGTSWVIAAATPVLTNGLPVTPVSGTTQTGVAGNHYLMTNVAASTFTLPPTPAANDEVWVTFTNGLYTNSVARNGKTIYGDSTDFLVNAGVLLTWKFKYLNTDWKTV